MGEWHSEADIMPAHVDERDEGIVDDVDKGEITGPFLRRTIIAGREGPPS